MDYPICLAILYSIHIDTCTEETYTVLYSGKILNLSQHMHRKTSISTQTEIKKQGHFPPLLWLLIIATPACTSAHLTSVQNRESTRLHFEFLCNITGRQRKPCLRNFEWLWKLDNSQNMNIMKSFMTAFTTPTVALQITIKRLWLSHLFRKRINRIHCLKLTNACFCLIF